MSDTYFTDLNSSILTLPEVLACPRYSLGSSTYTIFRADSLNCKKNHEDQDFRIDVLKLKL